MKRIAFAAAIAAGVTLAACSATGLNQVPGSTPVNLQSSSKLQFAVGTATLPDGTIGVNTVSTFRQSNGLAATLVNSPSITGPAGFTVPNSPLWPNGWGGPGSDAGTSTMTSLPQTVQPTPTPGAGNPYGGSVDTFGMDGGVFESGLAPLNTNSNGIAYYPGKPASYGLALPAPTPNPAPTQPPAFGQPFFAPNAASQLVYVIGPPAVPFFNDGSYPAGFAGYLAGFTAFEATPVAGSYTLKIDVGTSNVPSSSFSQSATLGSVSPLPALPAPVFTKDGAGGGTATVNVPADPRIVETLLFVYAQTGSGKSLAYNFYTVGPVKGTGAQTFVLPDKLGTCTVVGSGCQNGANASPSIKTGATYKVYAASFDYAQFEAEPPGNRSQTPSITGAGGQADVTLSPAASGTY